MISKLQDKLVSFDEAAKLLMAGGVGVLPTDTVYGLVARVRDKAAFERFYSTKKRDNKLGIIIAANAQQLLEIGADPKCVARAEKWWPKPVSVKMPTVSDMDYFQGIQAFRIVPGKELKKLLEKTGPLITTSANQPDLPTSVNVQQAWGYFRDSVDFYVNGGDYSNRPASTVVLLTKSGLEVVREGAVKANSLI